MPPYATWERRVAALSKVSATLTESTGPGAFASMGRDERTAPWGAVLSQVSDSHFDDFVERLIDVGALGAITDTTTLFDVAEAHLGAPHRPGDYISRCLDMSDGEFALCASVGSATTLERQEGLVRHIAAAEPRLRQMSMDESIGLVNAVLSRLGDNPPTVGGYAANVMAQLGVLRGARF